MCGIAGILDPRIVDKKAVIEGMTNAIKHRGPDDDGFYVDEELGLGMRRLSIIDLEGGRQPIVSQSGQYMIFFNGEIYNYEDLRNELIEKGHKFETKSDTEVVLRMFEVYGPDSVKRLRGMFAYAIYDEKNKALFIARDFFGIKPLYYQKTGERIAAFSSEIKSFLSLPGFVPEVNDAAVYNYLQFQYNPLEETFFKNVYKLMPGHYMTVDAINGTYAITRYWQFEFKPEDLDEDRTRMKILETMEDSVEHHMIADVPVGSFLSGGIDSSIIATLMQRVRGDKKIKTFTVGFETLSEGREAKETSEPLGTDHTEIAVGMEEYFRALPKAVWHFDEPVADPSAIGLYFLAKEARKHVKVVLSGEGSDELFGGYNIYLEPFARKKITWIPRIVLQMISRLPMRGANYAKRASEKLEDWYIGNASIFKNDERKRLWTAAPEPSYRLYDLYKDVEMQSDSVKMQYVDINTWLIGDILAKADKMTMAHSLELRVPFLDMEVAKLAETLPDKFKWRNGVTKYLLRQAFKSVLPESTRNRKKLGFPTPVRDWFKTAGREVFDVITGNVYIREKMDAHYIERIIADHTSGKADNSRKIYLLLMLAIWYNTFIEAKV